MHFLLSVFLSHIQKPTKTEYTKTQAELAFKWSWTLPIRTVSHLLKTPKLNIQRSCQSCHLVCSLSRVWPATIPVHINKPDCIFRFDNRGIHHILMSLLYTERARVVFRHRVMSCSLHHLTVPELPRTQLHLHLPDYVPAVPRGFGVLQAVYLATLCQLYKLSCSNLRVWQPEFLIYRACKFFRLTESVSLAGARFLPIWSPI